jgi:hypothetical protein
MVFHIRNTGSGTVSVPECLVFHDVHGVSVRALSMEDAMLALVDPVTEGQEGIVEVEGGFGWKLGSAVNKAWKAASNLRFIDEMMEYYLEGYLLYPGEEITGFLVVPGAAGSLERVELREEW